MSSKPNIKLKSLRLNNLFKNQNPKCSPTKPKNFLCDNNNTISLSSFHQINSTPNDSSIQNNKNNNIITFKNKPRPQKLFKPKKNYSTNNSRKNLFLKKNTEKEKSIHFLIKNCLPPLDIYNSQSLRSRTKSLFKKKSGEKKNKCIQISQTLNYYGQNSLKVKTTKALEKMNRILMKKSINYLYSTKTDDDIINYNNNTNKNILSPKNKEIKSFELDEFSNTISNDFSGTEFTKSKFDKNKNWDKGRLIGLPNKKRNSLYEKEKQKMRDRYNMVIQKKFEELDKCEKKFDAVIDNTLKKLNDAEHALYNFQGLD